MTPGRRTEQGHDEGEQQLYRCADCGKPCVARIATRGNVVVCPPTGCGWCGGEDFVPYETADIDTTPT